MTSAGLKAGKSPLPGGMHSTVWHAISRSGVVIFDYELVISALRRPTYLLFPSCRPQISVFDCLKLLVCYIATS